MAVASQMSEELTVHGNEVRGLLHPLLLLLIFERSSHGYDLIERLAGLGVPDVEPGHAYRVLRNMEHNRLVVSGWVATAGGPARRLYELTPAGRAELEEWVERLSYLERVLDGSLERWATARVAEATPAMASGPEPPNLPA
jgi:poly-beta-hydroxybutyrate-responsive repressor